MMAVTAARRLLCRTQPSRVIYSRPKLVNRLVNRLCAEKSSLASISALAANAENAKERGRTAFPNSVSSALCLLGGFTLLSLSDEKKHKTDCCGIAGVIATSNHDAR
jgi:hypothetical protein